MMSYATYPDSLLLNLVRQDDRSAFDVIYQRHWKSLYRSACNALGNTAQAADICQELFASFWEHRRDWNVANAEAYLKTALRTRILNFVRRDKAGPSFYEPYEIIVSSPYSSECLVREKEMIRLLEAYLETLSAKRRKIFLLHFTENRSTREIANQLGVNQKTIQNQLAATLLGLRRKLGFYDVVILTWMVS